jgi:acyl-coenzyme A synthetase/AMP-(fatty) acid ligase
MIDWLLDGMSARGDAPALLGPDGNWSFADIVKRSREWSHRLAPIEPGAVVTFDGDYGLDTIALLLALAGNRNMAVPLSRDVAAHHDAFRALSQSEYHISGWDRVQSTGVSAGHEYYLRLRKQDKPGLVLFTSGSTGVNKAAVHDLAALLDKFRTPRPAYRTLAFLQVDHIGGLNTLFHTLSNGGALVAAASRTPQAVCAAIESHRAELLPTSPTFLNLLLLSEEHLRRDLSSLRLITYGTEPMPASTLARVRAAFPAVRLLQTYGLSELGILRSQSRDSDSLWVRVGGEGFDTKIADGRLWIRARSAMLGYLNAPSPFDADGYFDTGDLVECDGEWIRFVGRVNEVINVGGNKVFPAEVESVLMEMENVADATVYGEASPITGKIVSTSVQLSTPEPLDAFKLRMRRFCESRLAPFQVPARVRFANGPLHNERFKRRRSPT